MIAQVGFLAREGLDQVFEGFVRLRFDRGSWLRALPRTGQCSTGAACILLPTRMWLSEERVAGRRRFLSGVGLSM